METSTMEQTKSTETKGRDWAAIGVTWSAGRVARRQGKNNSDKQFLPGTAYVMVLADFDKWCKHHPAAREAALASLDGQGWRVPAQGVNRAMLGGEKPIRDAEKIKEAVYARILGIRGGVQATVTIHNLPDGTVYEGEDEVEYRSEFAAALVDMGVDATVALAKAQTAKW